jgi:polysaccharide deacetylase family protein (PEP-CTERM system associated)
MPVTVTFDLEDNRRSSDQEARFVAMSDRFLGFLEQRGVTGTVFVVGELARTHPELVRRVAAAGHEIGLHGLRHVTLAEVGPDRLGAELEEGRALLEQVSQRLVTGFRAPIFSLTRATSWAIPLLAEAGFSYSSSVLPARNPLNGWPGAPRSPFRWPGGLIELPCPVAGMGPLEIPFLGGVYMRYLPARLARRMLSQVHGDSVLWSYSHPYDLDPDERFFVMPHAGLITSLIAHRRRRLTLGRLESLLDAGGGAGPPLGEVAASLAAADLPEVG